MRIFYTCFLVTVNPGDFYSAQRPAERVIGVLKEQKPKTFELKRVAYVNKIQTPTFEVCNLRLSDE